VHHAPQRQKIKDALCGNFCQRLKDFLRLAGGDWQREPQRRRGSSPGTRRQGAGQCPGAGVERRAREPWADQCDYCRRRKRKNLMLPLWELVNVQDCQICFLLSF